MQKARGGRKTKNLSQGCKEEGLTVFSMVTNLTQEERV